MLEDNVAGVEAAVDEDAEAAVVRVVTELDQLPEKVYRNARVLFHQRREEW